MCLGSARCSLTLWQKSGEPWGRTGGSEKQNRGERNAEPEGSKARTIFGSRTRFADFLVRPHTNSVARFCFSYPPVLPQGSSNFCHSVAAR